MDSEPVIEERRTSLGVRSDAAVLAMLHRGDKQAVDHTSAGARGHEWEEVAGHYSEQNPASAANVNTLRGLLMAYPRIRSGRPDEKDPYEGMFTEVDTQATVDILADLLNARMALLDLSDKDTVTLQVESNVMLEQLGFPHRASKPAELSALRPDAVMAAVITGKLQLMPETPLAAAA